MKYVYVIQSINHVKQYYVGHTRKLMTSQKVINASRMGCPNQ
ncbi:hypothetical protein BMS3Abin14_00930 [bacterium BMS3Abin14]|nr:hypothetical protein BMS3Abin14_00930 [bacterium BMS3Abin14]